MTVIIKTIKSKLNNQSGESISEVLVALLISALALVMLASMITTSSRIVNTSRVEMNEYYIKNNILSSRPSGVTSASIQFNFGSDLPLVSPGAIPVYVYENNANGRSVISYKLK